MSLPLVRPYLTIAAMANGSACTDIGHDADGHLNESRKRPLDEPLEGTSPDGIAASPAHAAQGGTSRDGRAPARRRSDAANTASQTASDVFGPSYHPIPRVALLPFLDATDSGDLEWIALGMMTLSVKAIAGHSGIAVSSVSEIVMALATLPETATVESKAQAVQSQLQVDYIVTAVVFTVGNEFELAWAIRSAVSEVATGRLRDAYLPRLAQRLGATVVEMLGPGHAGLASGQSGIDFAAQAYARAAQAIAQQRYPLALPLLRLCADVEPHPIEVDFALVSALTHTGDVAAVSLARQLVERMRAVGNRRSGARAQAALALCMLDVEGDTVSARLHWSEAQRLGLAQLDHADRIRLPLLSAEIALVATEYRRARTALDQAQTLLGGAEEVDSPEIAALCCRAHLLAAELAYHLPDPVDQHGECGRAALEFEQVAQLAQRAGMRRDLAAAQLGLAETLALSGRLREAAEQGAQALNAAMQVDAPLLVAAYAERVPMWLLKSGMVDRSDAMARQVLRYAATRGRYGRLAGALASSAGVLQRGDRQAARQILEVLRLEFSACNRIGLRGAWACYAELTLRLGSEADLETFLKSGPSPIAMGQDGSALELMRSARAVLSLRRGRRQEARALLADLLPANSAGSASPAASGQKAPVMTHVGVVARFTAVWMDIEDGLLLRAQAALNASGSTLIEYASTFCVRARMAYERGDFQLAVAFQLRYLELAGQGASRLQHQLLEIYRASAATSKRAAAALARTDDFLW